MLPRPEVAALGGRVAAAAAAASAAAPGSAVDASSSSSSASAFTPALIASALGLPASALEPAALSARLAACEAASSGAPAPASAADAAAASAAPAAPSAPAWWLRAESSARAGAAAGGSAGDNAGDALGLPLGSRAKTAWPELLGADVDAVRAGAAFGARRSLRQTLHLRCFCFSTCIDKRPPGHTPRPLPAHLPSAPQAAARVSAERPDMLLVTPTPEGAIVATDAVAARRVRLWFNAAGRTISRVPEVG